MNKKIRTVITAVAAVLLLCLVAFFLLRGCGKNEDNGEPDVSMTDTPKPTDDLQATPEPTAEPSATPEPTATSTPEPTATSTPEPTATSTPEPTATSTPVPTATSTPVPTATSTPVPTATSTPVPTATNTPTPTVGLTLGFFTPVDGYKVEAGGAGIILVSKDGKYGAMDRNGNLVVPCEYETVKLQPNSEGYFALQKKVQDSTLYSGKGGNKYVCHLFDKNGTRLYEVQSLRYDPGLSHVVDGKLLFFYDDEKDLNFAVYDLAAKVTKTTVFAPEKRGSSYTFGMYADGYIYFDELNVASYRVSMEPKIEKLRSLEYMKNETKVTLSDGEEHSLVTYSTYAPSDGWRIQIQYTTTKVVTKPLKGDLVGIYNIYTGEYRYVDLTTLQKKYNKNITDIYINYLNDNGNKKSTYGQMLGLTATFEDNTKIRVIIDFSKGIYDNVVGDYKIASNIDDMILGYYSGVNLCDNGYFHCYNGSKWIMRRPDGTFIDQYDNIGRFMNGYAPVVKDGKAYLINEKAEIVSEVASADFVTCYGYLYAYRKDGKYTYFWIEE